MLATLMFAGAVYAQEAPAPEAQVWVVFPARAVNLAGDEVVAADALFRLRMGDAVGAPLVGPAETRAAMGAGTDDAALQKACATLSCTRWATLDLIKLGTDIYVTAMLRDGKGAQVYRVDVVANGMGQLDENLDRISRALVEQVPYDKVPAKKTYTPLATPAPQPEAPMAVPVSPPAGVAAAPPVVYVDGDGGSKPRSVHGGRVGAWMPFSASAALSMAYVARWEHPGHFYEFDAGFVYPVGLDRFGGLYADLGVSKLLSAGAARFYFGGGGGPRPYIAYGSDAGFGGGLYGQAGVTNGSEAKTRLYAQLRLGVDVFNNVNFGGYYGDGYAGLEAGIGF
jgi:hypothetical protein